MSLHSSDSLVAICPWPSSTRPARSARSTPRRASDPTRLARRSRTRPVRIDARALDTRHTLTEHRTVSARRRGARRLPEELIARARAPRTCKALTGRRQRHLSAAQVPLPARRQVRDSAASDGANQQICTDFNRANRGRRRWRPLAPPRRLGDAARGRLTARALERCRSLSSGPSLSLSQSQSQSQSAGQPVG